MEKILIISYYWPPSAGSGVQRWLKFTKYLPDFGFKPIIYTPLNPHFSLQDLSLLEDVNPQVEVIKTKIWEPYKLAEFFTGKKTINQGLVKNPSGRSYKSRLLNYVRANFFIPDPRKFWINPSYRFLKPYLKKEGIKYLVTTGPPHSMHLIGLKLKRSNPDLKWIVDIRDPWSKFDFLKQFGSGQKALNKQALLEKQVLDTCDRVIATSESMKDLLVHFDHNKFYTITNGYDEVDFKNFSDRSSENKIVIYHAGLLNQLRNPENLWMALNHLCTTNAEINSKLCIHLVGKVDSQVINSIKSWPQLENKLTIEPYKPHKDVILDYAKSNVLLLLVNNTDNANANIPGKMFEYIASDKRVLSIASDSSDVGKILRDYKKSLSFNYEMSENLADRLEQFLTISSENIEDEDDIRYSFERKELTRKLVDKIKSIQ